MVDGFPFGGGGVDKREEAPGDGCVRGYTGGEEGCAVPSEKGECACLCGDRLFRRLRGETEDLEDPELGERIPPRCRVEA